MTSLSDMPRSKLRIGISGAGAITERAHIPSLKTLPNVEIVAIQSRTTSKCDRLAATCASESGAKPRVYGDFREMLRREELDAVCVFGPNSTHCDYAIAAIEAGAHVLVEKPMSVSSAQALSMVEAARSAHKVLMVAQQRRYSAIDRLAKEIVEHNVLGKVQTLRMRFSHGGPEFWAPGQKWFFSKKEAGGGVLLDLGVHLVDLMLWMLGVATRVTARVYTLRKDCEVEDNAVATIEFESGAIGIVEVSWTSQPVFSCTEIHCDGGRAMIGHRKFVDVSLARADGQPVAGYSAEEIAAKLGPPDMLGPYRNLMARFAAACAGSEVPFPSGDDGRRAIDVIEAAYKSAQIGRTITLGS